MLWAFSLYSLKYVVNEHEVHVINIIVIAIQLENSPLLLINYNVFNKILCMLPVY